MGTVLAVFAFILSFGALWFTSEILKRIDGHTETAIKPHLKAFETSLGNHTDALDRLSRRMDTLEVDVRTLKAQSQSTAGLEHEMKSLGTVLAAAEAKRFAPSIRLNG